MERSNPKSWVATLTPHRSLTRHGFLAVMGLIVAMNLIAGLVFFLIGAWPVIGFCGLDVAILWLAFRRNFADGRRAERIEITEHELVLERLPEGLAPEAQRFVRRWARVDLEIDRERELIGRLFIASHGQRTEIGSFLAPFERRELATALKAALATPRI
ncbi:MAG: DUF2244 domain-containing protein [Rhizobiales bacterium]|nr:DUF2244 domain-containing protein [Hyphomicrobiales bacterium]MBI3673233.1 DUF2244 domain-containing protein [Hyphomicrobiales bacterium]